MTKVPITDVAVVVRSKNSGPYELTLDIMFKKQEDYMRVKEAHFFTKDLVARIYGISHDKIVKIVHFDPAWAIKITLIRPIVSGAVGDTDVYGAQQHAPLLKLEIPVNER